MLTDSNGQTPSDPVGLSPTAVEFEDGDVGWQALGPAIALTTVSSVVVGLRWYARCKIVRRVGLDDYIILISLILVWMMSGLIGASVHHGVGKYHGDVNTNMIAKLIVAQNSVWAITVSTTKASILVQYLRIFNNRRNRITCYILMASLLPATCWGIFGGIFLCNPARKLWNPYLPGHCRDAQIYWTSVAGVDIGLDILVLLLPIPSISGLRLPRKQKIATMLVFLLGFLVCAVSVVRVATVVGAATQGDLIMSGIWSIIWSVTEANVGIICASLLALRVWIVRICPKLMEETEPPQNAQRLPMMENAEATWRSADSEAPTLGADGSLSTMQLKVPGSSQVYDLGGIQEADIVDPLMAT
ncbi:uncharacterized protein RCC_07656 [Ramularia collo-cygni]|uniref:Rhodopsin domain-containing protein n=1 Tax=Ramularia collo-cygni TaxID=112498 RepID=A0A2D3V8M8_9PEZI|nr:uncharacterized protein RCC_07656 [Ramularia collo-cygni]CZT21790.1 uncharacterized protein RCC_07656 [Ramularia collo-cygni]